MKEMQTGDLAGRRILIVEDEFFLADDLKRELLSKGAEVLGPANTLDRARALTTEPIDFAVLDVNLNGELIFPLADELHDRGVPFLFTTGYDAAMIPAKYRTVERLEKPFVPRQLVRALTRL